MLKNNDPTRPRNCLYGKQFYMLKVYQNTNKYKILLRFELINSGDVPNRLWNLMTLFPTY